MPLAALGQRLASSRSQPSLWPRCRRSSDLTQHSDQLAHSRSTQDLYLLEGVMMYPALPSVAQFCTCSIYAARSIINRAKECGNRAHPEQELSKTIFRPDISCLMNGFSFGYENKSKAWQQSTHLLARKLFMNSHASFAESTNPGEEVEENADSPRKLDCSPEAHHTAIATVYSSEHSSSCPANGMGS